MGKQTGETSSIRSTPESVDEITTALEIAKDNGIGSGLGFALYCLAWKGGIVNATTNLQAVAYISSWRDFCARRVHDYKQHNYQLERYLRRASNT